MENKEISVEQTSEPKVQSRFGFQTGSQKILSPNKIKVSGIVAGISLTILFLMKSPEPPKASNQSGIQAPETTQINNLSNYDLESYSVTEESKSIQQKRNNHLKIKASLRLPGIESISRQRISKLPPGLSCKATLTSGASNGLVRVETTEDLIFNGSTIIPAGTQLLGSGQTGDDRLYIKFTQAVFQNGNVENLQAQAADITDLLPGLKGSKFSKYGMKYGAAVGLQFIGGMSEGLQARDVVGQQIATRSDVKNAFLNGAGKAAMETANETMK
jgi:hypothetical protein